MNSNINQIFDKWISEHFIDLLGGMSTKSAYKLRPNGFTLDYFRQYMKTRCDRIRPRTHDNKCGRIYIYKLKTEYIMPYALKL